MILLQLRLWFISSGVRCRVCIQSFLTTTNRTDCVWELPQTQL